MSNGFAVRSNASRLLKHSVRAGHGRPAEIMHIFRSIVAAWALLGALQALAEKVPARGAVDSRVRVVAYNPDEVYRLQAYVGYQIDLQFEPGETFVGLGAGDIEGLSFTDQGNHLFLKPSAAKVDTNLTVLTNRRHYQFDYIAAVRRPEPAEQEVIYALRFTYPPADDAPKPVPGSRDLAAAELEAQLAASAAVRPRNVDYWYCGHPAVRPIAASDDGVHTRLRFASHSEQPAIFARNDDGSESLLNFSMEAGEVIVHRIAPRLIVRRGGTVGCIVNKGFAGTGERLQSGTVAPDIERATPGVRP
jgi:type IV secretion system protein VirB9